MRRTLQCAALATLVLCLLPGVAAAHPLGNFTVNRYSRIEPAADGVRVFYVLDMAEIPTFQAKPALEAHPDSYADERAEAIRHNLHLTLAGQPAALEIEHRALSLPEGQGGLPTLRLEVTYRADLPSGSPIDVAYRDDNEPARIGWREIVARPGGSDTRIQQSSVPEQDRSDELRTYPDDLLSSPLNVREAHLSVLPGSASARPLAQSATSPGLLSRGPSAFADLASSRDLSLGFILFTLGVAMLLGAAHALQPGHGKTIVAAYLVGSRGTPLHAVFLGATVTLTHTVGVYALGVVTLVLSQYILPDRLYPVLEVASGALVVVIGVWLFASRLLGALGMRRLAEHGHPHAPGHTHDHGDAPSHVHSHGGGKAHAHGPRGAHGQRVAWRSLLALGVSGGLLPCPEALMVLLITIAAHRVLFGLVLIVAFSVGLAAILVGFGLVLVYARAVFQRINVTTGLAPRLLPLGSALVIVVAGCAITAQALPQLQ